MRDLPPLSALRAFEAAARLGSFTAAGRELAMSQAAVSYQIKRLEALLGLGLFLRRNRRVSLTEDGERIAKAIIRAFDLIEDGVRRPDGAQTLSVTATASFANMWLSPTLGDFQDSHPDIELRVAGQNEVRDLEDGEYDVAVRSGVGPWLPLVSDKLFDIDFTPMCSPSFLRACGDSIAPADVLSLRRIAPQDPWWDIWLAEAASEKSSLGAGRGIRLNNQTECTAAARAGQGIAILIPAFAARDLADGTLVAPFGQRASDGSAYWLVYERARRSDPKITAFRRWLLAGLSSAITRGR